MIEEPIKIGNTGPFISVKLLYGPSHLNSEKYVPRLKNKKSSCGELGKIEKGIK
jgi:hypothetical protein